MRLMEEIAENRLLSRWATLLPRSPNKLGAVHESDAEMIPLAGGPTLALTVDTVAEEIRLGLYREPFTAGRTAAVAALSDLAAIGADPVGLLLAVTLPREKRSWFQEEVSRGISEVCEKAKTCVLGGDTSEGEILSITCVAAGLLPRESVRLRTGMRPGDLLFGSAAFGLGSALAAARWSLSPGLFDEVDYRPEARLSEGRALRGIASGCIDTSDGFIAALDQLARLNGVAIRIERTLQELLDPRAETVRSRLGYTPLAFLAGQHGEFELVFSVPPDRIGELCRVSRSMGWSPVFIGRVEPGSGLFAGDCVLDGARLRNLWEEAGGEVEAYVRALYHVGVSS